MTDLGKASIYFVGALVFVLLAVFLSSWIEGTPSKLGIVSSSIKNSTVTCPSDIKSFESTTANKNVVLLQNKPSHATGGKLQTYTVSLNRTGLNSPIACGYLLYRISVNGGPIAEKSENLFMTPDDAESQFGGHLLPNPNIVISDKNEATSTEVLMPLNAITYDGTQRVNIKQADWVSLLNVSNKIDFSIGLNSLRSGATIDSVEIAYKCENPQTGEETQDCDLQVAN